MGFKGLKRIGEVGVLNTLGIGEVGILNTLGIGEVAKYSEYCS